jgi:hypothetical protein
VACFGCDVNSRILDKEFSKIILKNDEDLSGFLILIRVSHTIDHELMLATNKQ